MFWGKNFLKIFPAIFDKTECLFAYCNWWTGEVMSESRESRAANIKIITRRLLCIFLANRVCSGDNKTQCF